MHKNLRVLIIGLCCFQIAFAQNDLKARLEFEEAEKSSVPAGFSHYYYLNKKLCKRNPGEVIALNDFTATVLIAKVGCNTMKPLFNSGVSQKTFKRYNSIQ